jgi:hypothetical protein
LGEAIQFIIPACAGTSLLLTIYYFDRDWRVGDCVAVPATAKRVNISALQIGGQFNLLFTIDNGSTLLATGLQLGN